MLKKLGQKFQQMMIGRNGPDNLARFSLWIALAFVFAGMFIRDPFASPIITGIAFAAIFYSYFRIFSRTIGKRREENGAFLRTKSKAIAPFQRNIAHFKEWKTYHKTHHIHRCKNCGQSLRVPKGKGTIKVTCPKCRNTFTTKS